MHIMDSDDNNISDHVGDLDIQSYQFEPLCNDESQQEREQSQMGLKVLKISPVRNVSGFILYMCEVES
jgi:hypothetical protein